MTDPRQGHLDRAYFAPKAVSEMQKAAKYYFTPHPRQVYLLHANRHLDENGIPDPARWHIWGVFSSHLAAEQRGVAINQRATTRWYVTRMVVDEEDNYVDPEK